jgi:hypothetical protein
MLRAAICFLVGDYKDALTTKQQLVLNTPPHETNGPDGTIWVPDIVINDIGDVEELRALVHKTVDNVLDAYGKQQELRTGVTEVAEVRGEQSTVIGEN